MKKPLITSLSLAVAWSLIIGTTIIFNAQAHASFSYSSVDCDKIVITTTSKSAEVAFFVRDGNITDGRFEFSFLTEKTLPNFDFYKSSQKLIDNKFHAEDRGRIVTLTKTYETKFHIKSSEIVNSISREGGSTAPYENDYSTTCREVTEIYYN